MSTWSGSTRILPVAESSTRSRSRRRIRNDDGTTPPAIPEWTPSVSTSTVSSTPRSPRSDVVTQSRS